MTTIQSRRSGLNLVIGAMGIALVLLAGLYGSLLHRLSGLESIANHQRTLISALRQEIAVCQQHRKVCGQSPTRIPTKSSAGEQKQAPTTVVVVKPPASQSGGEQGHRSHSKPAHQPPPKPAPKPSPSPSPTPCGPVPLLCIVTASAP